MKKVDVDWAAFRGLVVSGLPIREVARRLGVNPNTALSKAKSQNWGIAQLHGRGERPAASKQALARTERTVAAGKEYFRESDGKTKFNLAKAVVRASKTLSDLPGEKIIDNHQALHSVAKTAAGVFHWTDATPHPFLSIQGVMFNLSPDQLAQGACSFDELKEQYCASHPVREIPP
jgi:hypothetical protein